MSTQLPLETKVHQSTKTHIVVGRKETSSSGTGKQITGLTFPVCCRAAVELAGTCCGGRLSDQ